MVKRRREDDASNRLLWRTKAASVLSGVDKDEYHVTQVIRIAPQRRQIVLIANRVRVASQEPEVLDRHRSIDQKLVQGSRSFHDGPQDLAVSHAARGDRAIR